jgi:hypothetical protein
LLKLDCEGCEYDVLSDPALAKVNMIVGEFHGHRSRLEEAFSRLPGWSLSFVHGHADQGIFHAVNPSRKPSAFVRQNIVVNSCGRGIGDAVTGLLTMVGVANLGHRVSFLCHQHQWLAEFSHPLVSVRKHGSAFNFNADYAGQLAMGSMGKSGSRCAWHAKVMASRFGLPFVVPSFPNETGLGRQRPFGEPYTVLAPFCGDGSRRWPPSRWLELASKIEGKKVVVGSQGDNPSPLAGMQAEFWLGRSVAQVLSLLENARIVYSGDTGIAHLAGILGTPTAVICGPLPPDFVFGQYPSVRGVSAASSCRHCFWQPSRQWSPSCQSQCQALAATPAGDVFAILEAKG